MNTPNATVDIRHVIARTTAELLAAVNASDADRCGKIQSYRANAYRRAATDHPDWRPYALPYGPADDREADDHSVRFSVPVPREGRHRLEVALRGNTIDVAYDCGEASVRAEKQFVFTPSEAQGAVDEVRYFLRQVCDRRIVVVRRRLGRLMRALRADGASEYASFRSAAEAENPHRRQHATIHVWGEDCGRGSSRSR